MAIDIHSIFEPVTATFTHIVVEVESKKAIIIDSVRDYDQFSGRSSTKSADALIDYVKKNQLTVEWILDTHIHADHLTASHYLKENLGGKIGIGAKIQDVLAYWVPLFNTGHDTPLDGSQFDELFMDGETFKLGNTTVSVIHTPGHTPACACYLIEDAIFVGDTLFMPDLGTARADFPGGNASTLYDSIQKILSLPDDTRIYLCHDYPPEGREPTCMTTIKEEKEKNIFIKTSISKSEYVEKREKRDKILPVPKLIMPSIQTNLRAGDFGDAEDNGVHYIKIPFDKL